SIEIRHPAHRGGRECGPSWTTAREAVRMAIAKTAPGLDPAGVEPGVRLARRLLRWDRTRLRPEDEMESTPARARAVAAALVLLALGAAAPAHAQYFGRNAVQWDHLKFEVLKTDHFDIYYYPEEKDAAQQVGRLAERWYARLSTILNHRMQQRQPVILYAT